MLDCELTVGDFRSRLFSRLIQPRTLSLVDSLEAMASGVVVAQAADMAEVKNLQITARFAIFEEKLDELAMAFTELRRSTDELKRSTAELKGSNAELRRLLHCEHRRKLSPLCMYL